MSSAWQAAGHGPCMTGSLQRTLRLNWWTPLAQLATWNMQGVVARADIALCAPRHTGAAGTALCIHVSRALWQITRQCCAMFQVAIAFVCFCSNL